MTVAMVCYVCRPIALYCFFFACTFFFVCLSVNLYTLLLYLVNKDVYKADETSMSSS